MVGISLQIVDFPAYLEASALTRDSLLPGAWHVAARIPHNVYEVHNFATSVWESACLAG